MRKTVVAMSIVVCTSCYGNRMTKEVFRACLSYETPKKYKRNIDKIKKKLIKKIPYSDILLTAAAVYDRVSSNNIKVKGNLFKTKERTVYLNLGYDKVTNNTTVSIGQVIPL